MSKNKLNPLEFQIENSITKENVLEKLRQYLINEIYAFTQTFGDMELENAFIVNQEQADNIELLLNQLEPMISYVAFWLQEHGISLESIDEQQISMTVGTAQILYKTFTLLRARS